MNMKPTHTYLSSTGHLYYGVIVGYAYANLVYFLPLCNDNITWMKEPITVSGVREITVKIKG
jgi:hypothetical protein